MAMEKIQPMSTRLQSPGIECVRPKIFVSGRLNVENA